MLLLYPLALLGHSTELLAKYDDFFGHLAYDISCTLDY